MRYCINSATQLGRKDGITQDVVSAQPPYRKAGKHSNLPHIWVKSELSGGYDIAAQLLAISTAGAQSSEFTRFSTA